MSDSKHALVLHLAGGGEPLVYALSEEGAASLGARLPQLLADGAVDAPLLSDGSVVAVNFSHVATAHLDELPAHARVYGNGRPAKHGFVS